jgi:hypothetical protein
MRRTRTAGPTGAWLALLPALAMTCAACDIQQRVEAAARIARVYPLAPREGVFAYSRISPDGTHLAYSSEAPAARPGEAPLRTVRIVDLATKQVVFERQGIDAYFSPDGRRAIFLGQGNVGPDRVCMVRLDTRAVTCDVAPVSYGDYFSWATRDGRDLIATINSYYYYLDGDRAVMPAGRVPSCPSIGVGGRPLISKDGTRITTFVRGGLVVRNLTDCDGVVRTNMRGGKADFSWDGRYIAFHAQKPRGEGYEIKVVDLMRRRMLSVADLPGSSLFPSWTRDGRLSFRYDADDFRGFVIASDFMGNAWEPLPDEEPRETTPLAWSDVFPRQPAPASPVSVVLVWAPWNAHSPDALIDLQKASETWRAQGADVGVFAAAEPSSVPSDVARMKAATALRVPELVMPPDRVAAAGAHNHIPMVLVFSRDRLRDRRLGAQTPAMLAELVRAAAAR